MITKSKIEQTLRSMKEDAFDYGFSDGEPMQVLRRTVLDFLNGTPCDIPQTPDDWELYSEEGADKVALKLASDLRTILNGLKDLRLNELTEVLQLLGVRVRFSL